MVVGVGDVQLAGGVAEAGGFEEGGRFAGGGIVVALFARAGERFAFAGFQIDALILLLYVSATYSRPS